MDARMKAVFNWSGGKDSALALLTALRSEKYDVVSLLTTVSGADGRSTMHAIPERVLRAQAASIGIPLCTVNVTPGGEPEHDTHAMRLAAERFRAQGVTRFIFGDIFLHDVRTYREERLRPYGIEVVEPLWELSPQEAMEAFLASDLGRAIGQGVYRPQTELRDGGGLPRRNRPLRRERRIPYALLRRAPLPAVRRLSAGRTLPLVAGGRHGGWFAPYLLLLDCRHRLTARDRDGTDTTPTTNDMITIVARNVIREGKQEDFLKAVQPLIEASRAERGNVFYDLYEDVADSRAFCFIERWADEEAVAAHNASPHFRAWTAAKAEFVEAGTVARYRQR